MAFSSLEMPHPKIFPFPLRPTVQLITLSVLINKISGFYGLLALLTGYHLSWPQLSMYIYSILALLLTLYLYPHIRRASPWQNLLLAHFYILDTAVNTVWTAGFGVAWFWVLAAHARENGGLNGGSNSTTPEGAAKVPGAGMIDDTAGFTDPTHKNVSKVEVIGLSDQQSTLTYGAEGGSMGLGSALFASGSVASISVIVALVVLRVYFVFVMLAYARMCLRSYISSTSGNDYASVDPLDPAGGETVKVSPPSAGDLAENPFAVPHRAESQGWRGKLGRAMLAVAPGYWLGADKDEEWLRGVRGTFQRKNAGLKLNLELGSMSGSEGRRSEGEAPGTVERERRRRSGTGPPLPSVALPRFVGEN